LFKQPSSRRKSNKEQIELNLVPILDTMVALISFLLFTTSFIAIVSMQSPFPEISREDVQKKLTQKPLQLTVTLREREVELWSPFERIPAHTIPNGPNGQVDLKALHDATVAVKQKFPAETQVVLVPYAGASYDTLVAVMDSIRLSDPGDPPVFSVNPKTGVNEAIKTLFPDVIFGNLLGDG
jgi:biopolymer transport protein ExbD